LQSTTDILNILNDGGIILFPTDTIWGLGCRVDNIDAVKRIFAIKKRDFSKPFPLLVDSIEMLKNYVERIHPRIETLLTYHQYPLTMIYPQAKNLGTPAIHESGSVAIRLVQDEFCALLIKELGVPIVATSANYSGDPFPANFDEINPKILKEVDLVIQHRQNEKIKGQPSVIANYDEAGNLNFIRN